MIDADVVIIGAGMVGSACARALALGGRRVVMIERAHPGAGASGKAMGHVLLHDENEPIYALTRYAQRCWEKLAPSLPREFHRVTCGTVWVAREDDLEVARTKAEFARRHGLRSELLSAADVRRLEPNLAPDVAGGVFTREDSVVFPPEACRWFAEEAIRAGARLLAGEPVTRVEEGVVHLRDGSRLGATLILNACGAWAPELFPMLPIRRRKGHLVLTESAPGFVNHQVVELAYIRHAHAGAADSVAFNVQPRPGGRVLIGSCRQFDREGDELEPTMLDRMLARAFEFSPGLRELEQASAWTCFRPCAPDGLPIIGADSAAPWLWHACGHEGYGITTGIATGEIIADMIDGRAPKIDVRAFSPARFGV